MFLFKVQDSFIVTGRGLLLRCGVFDKAVTVGDAIKIIRPDKTSIETMITGFTFSKFQEILVGKDLTKEDVPIGSEVWLNKK